MTSSHSPFDRMYVSFELFYRAAAGRAGRFVEGDDLLLDRDEHGSRREELGDRRERKGVVDLAVRVRATVGVAPSRRPVLARPGVDGGEVAQSNSVTSCS